MPTSNLLNMLVSYLKTYLNMSNLETFQAVKEKHGVGVVMNTSPLFPCSIFVQCVFKVSDAVKGAAQWCSGQQ